MGILAEIYEGRLVIGLSGHKNESTVKQYARILSAKKKWEMCGTLADNILPKQAKKDQHQFTFKTTKPTATVSKPPEEIRDKEPTIELNIQENVQPEIEFNYEALDDPGNDDALVQFLAKFDTPDPQNNQLQVAAQENVNPNTPQMAIQHAANVPNMPVQLPANPLVPMNIQNIQSVNPNHLMPTLYFPNSSVTINYNFGK